MDEIFPQGRKLPPSPNLEHLQKQAKDRARDDKTLKLSAAQHQLAQEYGFKNWAELARAVARLSDKSKPPARMLCQQCGLKEATVHLSVVVSGKKTEEHLCEKCAEARSVTLPTAPLPSASKLPVVPLFPGRATLCFPPRRNTSRTIKEIEFDVRIPDAEFREKLREAQKSLTLGHRVKLRLKLRGPEMAHPELGFAVIQKAIAELAAMGCASSAPELISRNIHALVTLGKSPSTSETKIDTSEMKRYESSEWNFALGIPARWSPFPPVLTNSLAEVIRFRSPEDGRHLLIVFRRHHDPQKSLQALVDKTQQHLARKGYGNFVAAETTIGSRTALMLDFDRPQDDQTWSGRGYFFIEGKLGYVLGFGTTDKAGVFELYDRMAKSFEILPKSSPPSPGPG